MIFILILLSILVCLSAAIFGVDFYNNLKSVLGRYHIGCWPDIAVWKNAVIIRAKKWTIRTPTVRITDHSCYLLVDILKKKHRSPSIQSWQNASLILGLMEHDNITAVTCARSYLDKTGSWVHPPVDVDAGMLAYAILKVAPNIEFIKPAMDHLIDVIKKNTDEMGLISYCGGPNNKERYVDLIGLTCPFLAAYATAYGEPGYAKLAFNQIRFYHDNGLLSGSVLPCHAIHRDTGKPLGVYGWGRGTVWYVLGLLDTWLELPECEEKNTLQKWIKEAADSYLLFQRKDGGFGCILQREHGYDSSATAGLAYFYRICALLFHSDEYASCADHCLHKLMQVTRKNGSIDWCQGDTKDIGVFSQTYSIMPFAQGMALRSLLR